MATPRQFDQRASIVLIGVPGAGKRSLGFIAATHLKRRFWSENRYFETVTGTTKAQLLESSGREAVLQRSHQALQQLLEQNACDCVIECGASTLTASTRTLLNEYAKCHPVIHVVREKEDIQRSCPTRSSSNIHHLDLAAEHRSCSNFEFFNLFDQHASHHGQGLASSSILTDAKLDFCSFLDSILGRTPPLYAGPFYTSQRHIFQKQRSFATVWRLSQLIDGRVPAPESICGIDAVELRIDAWHRDIYNDINVVFASIRRLHSRVLIIYAVDGNIVDIQSDYVLAITHGLRLGVDAIAIDTSVTIRQQQHFIASKGYALAIADVCLDGRNPEHDWGSEHRLWERSVAVKLRYDAIRFVQAQSSRLHNERLMSFRGAVDRDNTSSIPMIAYNTGAHGRSSKVQNKILTPVSVTGEWDGNEPEIASLSGRVTLKQITQALFSTFEYDPLRFFIFAGPSEGYFRSPAMYNAAFKTYGLAHDMQYQRASSVEQILKAAHKSDFGGAAVSFPHKESTYKACIRISEHAEAIESVNSILPLRELSGDLTWNIQAQAQASERNRAGPVAGLYGDNTDWIGFYVNLRRHMSPRNAVLQATVTALVIGAGGSARAAIYALISIGYRNIYIRNRTRSRAIQVVEHFTHWCRKNHRDSRTFHVLEAHQTDWPDGASLPTAVVACVPTHHDFEMPDEWLGSLTGGAVLEISYQIQTPSILQNMVSAKRAAGGSRHWAFVDGYEILIEVAVVQFEFLTGYRAPREEMMQFLRPLSSKDAQISA